MREILIIGGNRFVGKLVSEDLYKNFVKPYMDGKNNDCEKVWSWLMFQKWYDINVVNLS